MITVKTYNKLAKICADNSPQGFPYVSPEILNRDTRKIKSVETILQDSPDVICLQEVDDFEYLHQQLALHSYLGISSQKYEMEIRRHYLAIFWKSSINCISEKFTNLVNGQGFLLLGFQHQDTTFYVGTTHLKAKNFAELRTQQGDQILYEVRFLMDEPLLIAGDFNADPNEPVCQNFKNKFHSAYELSENHYTTYKKRNSVTKRCIDYIWYRNMKLVGVQKLPDVESIPYPFLPNIDHPSDHLPLMAEFKI